MKTKTRKEREFEGLYQGCYSRMFYLAFDIIGDKEWAKDIVGEVFSQVWLQYEHISQTNLASYLYVLTRNRSIDFVRRQQRIRQHHQALARIEEAWYSEPADEREADLQYMYGIIDGLPDKTRHIFTECFLNGRKYQDVADSLQLSEASIHKYMVKAFATIREKFKKREER